MGRPCREIPDSCPRDLNRPTHPAEIEAWSIAGAGGAWAAPPHPRFKDRRPALNWAGVRNLHNPDAAPWGEVRPLLIALELAARLVVGLDDTPPLPEDQGL